MLQSTARERSLWHGARHSARRRENWNDWHGEEQGAEIGHGARAAQPKLAPATQQDLIISNHECNSLQRGESNQLAEQLFHGGKHRAKCYSYTLGTSFHYAPCCLARFFLTSMKTPFVGHQSKAIWKRIDHSEWQAGSQKSWEAIWGDNWKRRSRQTNGLEKNDYFGLLNQCLK